VTGPRILRRVKHPAGHSMMLADLGGVSTAPPSGYPQGGSGHLGLDKTVSAAVITRNYPLVQFAPSTGRRPSVSRGLQDR
jgi:hypothetical protein